MNASLFSAQVIGYIGHVRAKPLQAGGTSTVYAISVCVTTTPEQDQPEPANEWVEGIIRGSLAGAVGKYLQPGRLIYMDGAFENKRFVKKDGSQGTIGRLKVANFRFLDSFQQQ